MCEATKGRDVVFLLQVLHRARLILILSFFFLNNVFNERTLFLNFVFFLRPTHTSSKSFSEHFRPVHKKPNSFVWQFYRILDHVETKKGTTSYNKKKWKQKLVKKIKSNNFICMSSLGVEAPQRPTPWWFVESNIVPTHSI